MHPALNRQLVKRGVASLADKFSGINLPRRPCIINDKVCRRAGCNMAALQPQQARWRGSKKVKQTGLINQAIPHKAERQCEQGFSARRTRISIGKGQALGLWAARIMRGAEYINCSIRNGGQTGLAIGLGAQRRAQARKSPEIMNGHFRQEEMGGGNAAGNWQSLCLCCTDKV